jgi:hypothetical protein
MLSTSDAEQLAFAASSGRAIFTHNIHDYMRLSATYAREGRSHSGILYSSDESIAILSGWLSAAAHLYPDMTNLTLGLPLAG